MTSISILVLSALSLQQGLPIRSDVLLGTGFQGLDDGRPRVWSDDNVVRYYFSWKRDRDGSTIEFAVCTWQRESERQAELTDLRKRFTLGRLPGPEGFGLSGLPLGDRCGMASSAVTKSPILDAVFPKGRISAMLHYGSHREGREIVFHVPPEGPESRLVEGLVRANSELVLDSPGALHEELQSVRNAVSGLTVEVDENLGIAVLRRGQLTVKIGLGANEALVNGERKSLGAFVQRRQGKWHTPRTLRDFFR